MNKAIIGVVAVIILIGGYFFLSNSNQPEQDNNQSQQQSSSPTPSQKSKTVAIRNHQISIPEITVAVGTTVTWTNEDNLSGLPYDNHSATSGVVDPSGAEGIKGIVPNSGSGTADGTFSLAMGSNQSASFTFDTPGTYTYYIAEHPLVSGEGTVIVTDSSATSTGIDMEAGNFYYTPNTLTAKAGEEVSLNIKSTGTHTFTIDELGVDVILPFGQTTEVKFTPEVAGTYEFYCTVPGHREGGQIGSLTVI